MNLRVSSFNVRYDTPNDGINCFDGRKGLIQRALPTWQADLIGFQEMLPRSRVWFEATFPEYVFLGAGRDACYSGEHTPIAYRKEAFELVETATFWLSDTPYVPASRFDSDQSPCPRICTLAVLYHRATRSLVRFYNTHLDHVGARARLQGIELVLQRIREDAQRYPGAPFILTGDLNDVPGSAVVGAIMGFSCGGRPTVDATAGLGDTFHAYHPGGSEGCKIDYIFSDALVVEGSAACITEREGEVFISDHYPILATLAVSGPDPV